MGQARHPVAPKTVLERVLVILDCFMSEEPQLTLAELTSRTKIPKPTVHRLTGMLVKQRLLERTRTGYALGIRLFELGELAGQQRTVLDASLPVLLLGEQRTVLDASLPVLEELFEQTHETNLLGLPERREIPNCVKIVMYRAFPLPMRTDGRRLLHASAAGKALLAFGSPDRVRSVLQSDLKPLTPYTITDMRRLSLQVARVRREGVAYESEETVLGNACVASPIFNRAADPVAAVSISGPPLRLRAGQRALLVRQAAATVTGRIGGRLPDCWQLLCGR